MRNYAATATFSFSLEAMNKNEAQERAETVVCYLFAGIVGTPQKRLPSWLPDLHVPEIYVEEK